MNQEHNWNLFKLVWEVVKSQWNHDFSLFLFSCFTQKHSLDYNYFLFIFNDVKQKIKILQTENYGKLEKKWVYEFITSRAALNFVNIQRKIFPEHYYKVADSPRERCFKFYVLLVRQIRMFALLCCSGLN